jgi:hypothetical protein
VKFWRLTLSRVDFAFDYELTAPDFDSDRVVSLSAKDAKYRGNRKVQTIQYVKGDVVLRIYNKGNAQCASRNIAMEKLDGLVLDQLANRVFAPERLRGSGDRNLVVG